MAKNRYEGPRWDLICGCAGGVERTALIALQAQIQRYLPYVVEVRPAAGEPAEHGDDNRVLTGTEATNQWIADLVRRGLISIPGESEGFTVACMDSPWSPDRRLLAVAGADERGVLHGVREISAHVLKRREPDKPDTPRLREALDSIEDLSIVDFPRIHNRGIWTWGYVIYDYRGFLENMSRLRMNMLTIWNDCPPLNIREILEFAHARGIRVILGFHWGWGLPDLELTRAEDRAAIREMVLRNYRDNYHGLGIDGIYFQTLTEHHVTEKNGMTTAAAACELVNDTARALLEDEPDLVIQFGLHATSIGEHYVDFASLDPRVTIVWEDAGQVPFSYTPAIVDPAPAGGSDTRTRTVDETREYAKELAGFRPNVEFGMVPKGWTNLDWRNEFEHHGPFVLGERDSGFIKRRLRDRQPHWNRVNDLWLRNYPAAARFYREILEIGVPSVTVTGLVEDGLFEARVHPSVALFAETVWNPFRDDGELLRRAMFSYNGDPSQ